MHRSNSMLCLHCTVDDVVVNDSRWCEIDDGSMVFFCEFEQVVPNWQRSVIMNRMRRSGNFDFCLLVLNEKIKFQFFTPYMWAMITISRSLRWLWATFDIVSCLIRNPCWIFVDVSYFPITCYRFTFFPDLIGNWIVSFALITTIFVLIVYTWRNWARYLAATLTGRGTAEWRSWYVPLFVDLKLYKRKDKFWFDFIWTFSLTVQCKVTANGWISSRQLSIYD